MPSPTVLDPAPLLAPLAPDPAGVPTARAGDAGAGLRAAMEAARLWKAESADDKYEYTDADTGQRKMTEQWAELPFDPAEHFGRNPAYTARMTAAAAEVVRAGQTYLAETGKDLAVAAAVLDGAVKVYGFAGLRDGLRLLRRLCADGWDRLLPPVPPPPPPAPAEDAPQADKDAHEAETARWEDAVKRRARPLAAVLEADGTYRLPATVRAVRLQVGNLLVSAAAARPIEVARGGDTLRLPAELTDAAVRAAVAAATSAQRTAVQTAAEDLAAAADELAQWRAVLDAKAGKQAPSFRHLEAAVADTREWLAGLFAPGGGPVPPAPGPTAPGPAGPVTFAPVVPAGPTRADLYDGLNRLADALALMEPHSPVPLFVRRALELKDLSFPELVERLSEEEKLYLFLKEPKKEKER